MTAFRTISLPNWIIAVKANFCSIKPSSNHRYQVINYCLDNQIKQQGRLKTLIPVFRRPLGKCLNQLADSTP